MGLAWQLENTPEDHVRELRSTKTLDARSRTRLHAIASTYAHGTAHGSCDAHIICDLHYELKSARERFALWDDLTIARAIEALTDPTGW